MIAKTPMRLGNTYRVTVPFYDLADGTTPADLSTPPTLQAYEADGVTAVGSPVSCTKETTGVYYGDLSITGANGFVVGESYIWKMYGFAGSEVVNQSGEFYVTHVW